MDELTAEERKRALDDYDAEILDLVRKTQTARTSRNVLVPACSLLPELLLTVFLHVVEDWFYASHFMVGEPRYGLMSGHFPPMRLDWRPSILHVCHRWREVAASTCLLWQYIVLDELEPLLYESLEKTNSLPKWVRTHTYSFQLNNQVLASVQMRQMRHLALLQNAFASLELLRLDLYSMPAVEALLQITETFPVIESFDLSMAQGSYFSPEQVEEHRDVINRLPSFILQMPNIRYLWLSVPWTIELASLPPRLSSISVDIGLRMWGMELLPPPFVVPLALWNSLERLKWLMIGRNYIGVASETTKLAFPFLQRLCIREASAHEVVAFLDVVSAPTQIFIELENVIIGHADHLAALKGTVKRLTAPLPNDQLSSRIKWELYGPPAFRSSRATLHRGIELSNLSSRPSSGFTISFLYSKGVEATELVDALRHPDLCHAFIKVGLQGTDPEVTNSALGITRSISDALKGPSDLTSLEGLRLKLFAPNFSHEDWIALLGYSDSLRHISVGSLLEVDDFVASLVISHPECGHPLFPALKRLAFISLRFNDQGDGLLGAVKWRETMDVGWQVSIFACVRD
ncbi:hypothetical protein DL96DRAFT_1778570 [Flagelloscypha sp. PMI_526]|nr:hypothetical protein DL96DRAFT_1778570 [Flagelloscypha sp. PMI_526]